MMSEMLLQLYVVADNVLSKRAIDNIRDICDQSLKGRVRLEIIDVVKEPDRAEHAKILATPTLIRRLPPPLRRIVGDLSDRGMVEAVLASPADPLQE
ncbi:MAG: circadian clock protein KaiB [Salinisphaeraceae bacterium]|nr:circadian clock protein KaiB [Salinisphaeraceae bacterium]